jgi:dihydrolipoamide dehydrogenase-binding protein of pyruvate dehydrogenase complex
METGKIIKWHKAEGEAYSAGDPLCDVETDKATLTMDAIDDGVLAKILVEEGTENVKIKSVIALAVEEGDDYTQVEIPPDLELDSSTSTRPSDLGINTSTRLSKVFEPTSLPLSPAVKRLVKEHHLDINNIVPSGSHGRLLKGDVLSYLSGDQSIAVSPLRADDAPVPSQQPSLFVSPKVSLPASPKLYTSVNTMSLDSHKMESATQFDDIPTSGMRKGFARRLADAKITIPHSYASIDCAMDSLLDVRENWKTDEKASVSLNDFILKAAAVALKLVPDVNCKWTDIGPQPLQNVTISFAVEVNGDTVTPVIQGADHLTVQDISSIVQELISQAKDGKLQPHEYQGGSMCVSNLGMYGVNQFSAVIDPAHSCILAVGSLQPVPDPENGVANISTVTLSSDARLIDEKMASDFLRAFKRCVESPLACGV